VLAGLVAMEQRVCLAELVAMAGLSDYLERGRGLIGHHRRIGKRSRGLRCEQVNWPSRVSGRMRKDGAKGWCERMLEQGKDTGMCERNI